MKKFKIEGYYHDIQVIRNAGKANQKTETYCAEKPSKNLILDAFFERWLNGEISSSCRMFVGTGSTSPSPEQNSLISLVGSASNFTTRVENNVVQEGADYIMSSTYTADWNIGTIVGNLSEIGCNLRSATTTGALDSRALLLDSLGDPTSIPVTADDKLVAKYTLRIRIPITTDISNVTFDGVNTTCTLETLNVFLFNAWIMSAIISGVPYSLSSSGIAIFANQEIINDPESNVTTSFTLASASVSTSRNLNFRRATISANTSQFNQLGASGIKYIGLRNSSGVIRQGIHFDPPLAKDDTKTLVLNFDYGLERA